MNLKTVVALTGITLGSSLLTGCASSGAAPSVNGSDQNLLQEVARLRKQQADTQALLEKLQSQLDDTEFLAQQALSTAEAAQSMSAASDDKLEQMFQSSQFK